MSAISHFVLDIIAADPLSEINVEAESNKQV